MRHAERPALRVDYLYDGARLGAAPVDYVTGKDPWMPRGDAAGAFPVDANFDQRIACSRAMRSAVEGWVENRFAHIPALNGLMMNRCAVAGVASIGIRFE